MTQEVLFWEGHPLQNEPRLDAPGILRVGRTQYASLQACARLLGVGYGKLRATWSATLPQAGNSYTTMSDDQVVKCFRWGRVTYYPIRRVGRLLKDESERNDAARLHRAAGVGRDESARVGRPSNRVGRVRTRASRAA